MSVPVLTPKQLARDLAIRDLTDPAEGPHVLQLLVTGVIAELARRWPDAHIVEHRGPRIVPVADNYTTLGYAADAAARDARYARYVDPTTMLRAHTSALVPAALRSLAASAPTDDVVVVCPGIVYRRDSIDRLHTGTPHQVDVWRLRQGRRLGEGDLEELIDAVAASAGRHRRWRTVPRTHPYTTAGRQVDVAAPPGWMEVAECGLAHPGVLGRVGLDPESWSGLALGAGLDRLAMLRKGIDDIRLLRSSDPRVAEQLADLEPYRPVSAQPAVTRDLSVAVAAADDLETLGDRVRDALGSEADSVEEVQVLSETAYGDLPPVARARLGMGSDQKNVLVRVTLRRLDRALTRAEANRLRERVHGALHRGRSPA